MAVMVATASLGVQPWFASNRIPTSGPTAARIALTRATSARASVPTLAFSRVKPAATLATASAATASTDPTDSVTSVTTDIRSGGPPR